MDMKTSLLFDPCTGFIIRSADDSFNLGRPRIDVNLFVGNTLDGGGRPLLASGRPPLLFAKPPSTQKFRGRFHKVSPRRRFTCPNVDGTVAVGGCVSATIAVSVPAAACQGERSREQFG